MSASTAVSTSFTAAFSDLPANARKTALKSVIGSLNSSVIGYVRTHIRQSRFENISREVVIPTIDDYNDAQAQIGEAAADDRAMNDMGLAYRVPAIEVARKLEVLRGWCITMLADIARTPNDVPLSISDTLTFQMTREPNINAPALKALAAALELDVEALTAAKVKMHQDDLSELQDMAGQIATMVSEFPEGDDDEDMAEEAFDQLPVQLQYKLMATVSTACKKAGDRALTELLRFNRISAAGDIALIKGVCRQVNAWGTAFISQRSAEFDAYVERGGRLAEMAVM